MKMICFVAFDTDGIIFSNKLLDNKKSPSLNLGILLIILNSLIVKQLLKFPHLQTLVGLQLPRSRGLGQWLR